MAPSHEEDELLFLTIVLSSPLTQYLLFHTTANIGIERDVARLEEILELPFPLPEDMPNPKLSESILKTGASRMRKLRSEIQKPNNFLQREGLIEAAQQDLHDLVYKYFEMCDWELQLVQDTVGLFRPSSTPGSLLSDRLLTVAPSNPVHRREYAESLVKNFRDWSRTNRSLWAEGHVATKIGLALITLGLGDQPKKYCEDQVDDNVVNLLESIRQQTSDHGVQFTRLKGFVLYEADRVHILKPLNRRHWTRTSAMNDADEILTRMMKENGWRD